MIRVVYLREELTHHLPFTIFFGASGILLAGLLTYVATLVDVATSPPGSARTAAVHSHGPDQGGHDSTHSHESSSDGEAFPERANQVAAPIIFHVFHPVHLLFSAMATTAMFWRYDRRWLKAILIGAAGSIGVCGISDIALPFVGGTLLGTGMSFHWCLLDHPHMVVPFVVVGIVGGLLADKAVERSTVYSHSGHVFISSVASIFYLLSFGLHDWVNYVGYVFVVVVLAVMIPCCASDIVLPLAVTSAEGAPVHCHSRYHAHDRPPDRPHGRTPDEHEHGAKAPRKDQT